MAAAAGQPLARIARLYWPDPRHYLRDPEGFRRMLRPGCRRCTARYGIPGPVACHLPPHLTVCRRHRLWIGPSARTHAGQPDISQLPRDPPRPAPPPYPGAPPPLVAGRYRYQRCHPHHLPSPPRRRLDPATAAAPGPARPRHLAPGRARRQPRLARPRPWPPAIEIAIYPDVIRLAAHTLQTQNTSHRAAP